MRHLPLPGLAIASLIAFACSFEPSLPGSARLSCHVAADCPAGLLCHAERCVPAEGLDSTPPDLARPADVSPAVARAGATFTLLLETTEPLATPPEVTLQLEGLPTAPCTEIDGHQYRCTYRATGDENGGQGGLVPFDVALTDRGNNTIVRRQAGTLRLDFTPPAVATTSLAPAVARRGSRLQVFFASSEPLSQAARLEIVPPLANGTLAQSLLPAEGGTLNHRFEYEVGAAEPAQVEFRAHLVDVAGNESTATLGAVAIDVEAPRIDLQVGPERSDESGTITAQLTLSEPLDPAQLSVAFADRPMDCAADLALLHYTCGYTLAGDENGPGVEAVQLVVAEASDAAGNRVVAGETVVLDFRDPGIGSHAIGYVPAVGSPLPEVSQGGTGTEVRVTVFADEPLDTLAPLTLTVPALGSALAFEPVPGTLSSAGGSFRATVPAAAPDGTYDAFLGMTDRAGNSVTRELGAPIRLKTSRPVLAIDQNAVLYVRSPTGNAAPEARGSVVVPSGPTYSIGPSDPLAPSDSLATSAFAFADGSAPRMVRFWGDADARMLVGSALRASNGTWPRTQLGALDLPAIYVTGLDEAGNESTPVKIEHAEWVATAAPPPAGASPHRAQGTLRAEGDRELSGRFTVDLAGSLDGADGEAVVLRAKPTWTDRTPSPEAPAARGHVAMAYDGLRGRLVAFGGGDPDSPRDDLWEWDGTSWRAVPRSEPWPPARTGHAVAFDTARGRLVLFGGIAGAWPLDDLWEWDGKRWAERAQEAPRPAATAYGAMAYDPVRERTVLVAETGGVWEWDGQDWDDRTPPPESSAPTRTHGHALAFDPGRARILLFGGRMGGAIYGTGTWEWDGAAWTMVADAASSPPGRRFAGMAADPRRGRVVLFGGDHGTAESPNPYADLWEWDGSTWTAGPVLDRAPGGRYAHGAAYHPAIGAVVFFGGADLAGPSSELWAWDGALWRGGAREWPSARFAHASAFDTSRGRLLMFGGGTQLITELPPDLWEWDGLAWTRHAPATSPTHRYWPVMTWDSDRDRLLMFGGYTDELWEWNGVWNGPTVGGPGSIFGGAFAFDPVRAVSVLFSGPSLPLHEWNGTAWTSVVPSGDVPGSNVGAAMAFAGDSTSGAVVLHDGGDGCSLWRWSGAAWGKETPTGACPEPRWGHRMAYDGDRSRLVLVGGQGGSGYLMDVWQWTGTAWQQVQTAGTSPKPRTDHVLEYDAARRKLVLFGGWPLGRDEANDVWELDFAPSRAPAAQLVATLPPDIAVTSIAGLRVRARAGGDFASGSTSEPGARLSGWKASGSTPGWTGLASNSFSAGTTLPWPESAQGSWIDWRAADQAAAKSFVVSGSGELAFRVEPNGPSSDDEDSRLAVDYLEVRVAYRP